MVADYGLVSIIMPAYNAASYISQSIESVLAQSYQNWELLVVDDCSSDKTIEVVNSFGDKRVRCLRNQVNSGAAVSRNRALREAKGRWIAFLDSDDVWAPLKLETQLHYMINNNYAFSFTDYAVVYSGNKLGKHVITAPDVVTKRDIYRYCFFFTSTVMYDIDVVGLIQIEDLKKNNDYAMWLLAAEKTSFHRVPECLSLYYKHEGSISSGMKIRLIIWHYRLFRAGMHFSPFRSTFLTVGNLFWGVYKKIHYRYEPDDFSVILATFGKFGQAIRKGN